MDNRFCITVSAHLEFWNTHREIIQEAFRTIQEAFRTLMLSWMTVCRKNRKRINQRPSNPTSSCVKQT